MPATYTLIASNTLSSSAASVTFSSIPNTYTDLVLKLSVRSARTDPSDTINFTINSIGGTSYSNTALVGNGSAASSGRVSNANDVDYSAAANAATSTSNTFSNVEIYIPNYAGSTNKPFSAFTAYEDNTTTAVIRANASLLSNTAAVTSITMATAGIGDFVSGSSFYLYGIKNS